MHFHYSCELFKCHKELFNLPTLPTIINWHWLGWGIAERNSLRKEKQLAAPQCRSDSAAACRIDLATLRTSPAVSGRLTHRWEFGRHDVSSLCLVFSVLFLSPRPSFQCRSFDLTELTHGAIGQWRRQRDESSPFVTAVCLNLASYGCCSFL